jgi:hypothetical protein
MSWDAPPLVKPQKAIRERNPLKPREWVDTKEDRDEVAKLLSKKVDISSK